MAFNRAHPQALRLTPTACGSIGCIATAKPRFLSGEVSADSRPVAGNPEPAAVKTRCGVRCTREGGCHGLYRKDRGSGDSGSDEHRTSSSESARAYADVRVSHVATAAAPLCAGSV